MKILLTRTIKYFLKYIYSNGQRKLFLKIMICSNQNIRPFYPKLCETFFHNTNRREEERATDAK